MVQSNWFGKGCKYLSGMWEIDDVKKTTYEKQDYEPILVLCTHNGNRDKYEGNCNPNDCPLNFKS